jgi:hypothetical protein
METVVRGAPVVSVAVTSRPPMMVVEAVPPDAEAVQVLAMVLAVKGPP